MNGGLFGLPGFPGLLGRPGRPGFPGGPEGPSSPGVLAGWEGATLGAADVVDTSTGRLDTEDVVGTTTGASVVGIGATLALEVCVGRGSGSGLE